MNKNDLPNLFVEREQCIACGSRDLKLLAGAAFEEEPVYSFIANDPWGESPIPYLEGESWAYVKCCHCDQKFHRRIIAPEWEETLFSKWMSQAAIEKFEQEIGANNPRNIFEKTRSHIRHVLRLEKLTASLRKREAMRVMDFGCGWGGFLSVAKQFGAEACGIDADPDRRRAASKRDLVVFSNLGEINSDLRGVFHVIALFQVLEHLPAPLAVLKDLAEWLTPRGILILETPDCSGVSGIRTLEEYRAINPLSHINAFTPTSLKAIARNAGFRPIFPGVAHATTSSVQVFKTETKRQIGRFLPATTDQYFRLS